MGSEVILKRIKSGAFRLTVLAICLVFIPLITLFCIYVKTDIGEHIPFIIITVFAVISGAALFVYNIRVMSDPKNSMLLKKNPDILLQADELYQNIIYQDKNLIFSSRIIANAANITQISYTDEVFVIYVYIHKTNGVTDQKLLKLETARNTIQINIITKKDEEINELIGLIVSQCRYARVGYNTDSMAYLKQMKELWKKDQEQKNNNI